MTTNLKKGAKSLAIFYKTYRGVDTLLLEILIGILSAIGSIFIFFRLADTIIDKQVIFYDRVIMDSIISLRSPFLTSIMKSITFLGSGLFIGISILIVIFFLVMKKHKKDALIFSFLLFFGILLNLLLKVVVQRQRPTIAALVTEKTFSFPSGHSMNSLVFFLSVTFFIFRNTRNRKLGILLTTLSTILVFLIGVSRIYLGVHYPSDVLGGYAAGLIWFVAVLLFEKIVIFLRLFREYELNKQY